MKAKFTRTDSLVVELEGTPAEIVEVLEKTTVKLPTLTETSGKTLQELLRDFRPAPLPDHQGDQVYGPPYFRPQQILCPSCTGGHWIGAGAPPCICGKITVGGPDKYKYIGVSTGTTSPPLTYTSSHSVRSLNDLANDTDTNNVSVFGQVDPNDCIPF